MDRFSIKKAFGVGLRGAWNNLVVFLFFFVAVFSVTNVFSVLLDKIPPSGAGVIAIIVVQTAVVLFNVFAELSGSYLSLRVAGGDVFTFSSLWERLHLFKRMFVSFIVYGLIFLPAVVLLHVTAIGVLLYNVLPYELSNSFLNSIPYGAFIYNSLLTLPDFVTYGAIITGAALLFFAMRFQFYRFFIVDREFGLSSLKESFLYTRGINLRLFVFSLAVYFLISFSIYVPLVFSVFQAPFIKEVTLLIILANFLLMPVAFVARADAYRQLVSKR